MARKLDEPFSPGCGNYEPEELVEAVLTWWHHFQRQQGLRPEAPLGEEAFREACGLLWRSATAVEGVYH